MTGRPPPKDQVTGGGDINPYIPKYISSAPWYAGDAENKESDDYLKHQRSTKEEIKTQWYKRGEKKPSSTKYRKGACTNCGSMTHKAKDCLERPRKIGAKYSGLDIRADDDILDITTTWDSKRDRWNGFDADDYKGIMEQMAERRKAEETEQKAPVVGEDDLPVRSLRERGDKAKYLDDLDDESTYFNPKSRIMQGENGQVREESLYEKKLKDKALEYQQLSEKADKAAEDGMEIHMEANPTQGMLKMKQMEQEKKATADAQRKALLEKYGGQAHMQARPKELSVQPVSAETVWADNAATQSSPRLSAQEAKSRYLEDAFPGNHTTVWGSFWIDGYSLNKRDREHDDKDDGASREPDAKIMRSSRVDA